jgi:branched-chain amino acid transport system ATP-binding protein
LATDALRLEDVHAFYGDSHVLQGVSLAVPEGGVLGLLGRNGVGKTTCISTVMGLVRARGGSIVLRGRRIEALGSEAILRAGIGLVPQGRRIFPTLTVAENLSIPRWRCII